MGNATLGSSQDAAAAAGGAGTIAAQARRVTTDLSAVLTAIQAVRTAIEGTLATKPQYPIQAPIDVSLVGVNDLVATGKMGASVLALSSGITGEILHLLVTQTADNAAGGAILSDLAGEIYFFESDPTIAAGDSSPAKTDFDAQIAKISVLNGELTALASGSSLQISDKPIAFRSPLWAAFRSTGATTLNSAAGDDEKVRLRAWYLRHS